MRMLDNIFFIVLGIGMIYFGSYIFSVLPVDSPVVWWVVPTATLNAFVNLGGGIGFIIHGTGELMS